MIDLRQSDLRQSDLRQLDIGPEASGDVNFDGSPTAAVVAGCIVALEAGVSEQHSRDVLQSLLLAQLAANAKADRHRDGPDWYRVHQSTLEQVGWVTSTSSGLTRYLPATSRYTISSVIGDALARRDTAEEMTLVRRALAAFTGQSGLPAQLVFECPSHSGGIGNFQFALAGEADNGTLGLQVLGVTFEAPAHVTRLGSYEFDSNAKFMSSYVEMALNEEAFARLRATVEGKLASRFDASVAQITLTDN